MHYSLRRPAGDVIGLQLDAEELGREIYQILDWADQSFDSYSVKQTGGHVYVCSDDVEKAGRVRKEPLKSGSEGDRRPSTSSRGGGTGGDSDESDGPTAEPALQ